MITRSRRLLGLAQNKGAALIIVLAFVVLLTGLVVAYFSRTATDRQLAQSSFNDTTADLLARSALDIVLGDFKQEIVNGSTNIVSGGTPFYSPSPIPVPSGTPIIPVLPMRNGPLFAGNEYPNDPIPNLVRRSARNEPLRWPDPLLGPAVSSLASPVSSTTDPSANGRSISLDRWNKHYLIPRHDPTAADSVTTPISPLTPPYGPADLTGFTPPDWVLVTRNGPAVQAGIGAGATALNNPVSTNTSYVIGRYAYAVYDEGGLLDINVAAYPSPSPSPIAWVTDVGRKGVLAFADLTTLPTTPGNTLTTTAINKFILFRNYATTGSSTLLGAATTFNASAAANFGLYYLGPVGWTASVHLGTTQDFGTVNPIRTGTGTSSRTDQNFVTRTELIKFRESTGIASVNTLQYLGTFSREKNIATWRADGITTNQIESTLGAGRFYMGDLDLIRPPATGIQSEFSLKWKSGSAPATAGFWSYKGPSNPKALDHIPALAGPTGRFAGLLNYAMNKTGDDDYSDLGAQLGTVALLVDQYDSNTGTNASVDPITGSTTTVIAYNAHNHTTIDGDVYVYGMENSDPNRPPWAPIPPTGYVQLDRPFRNVGECGYAFNRASIRPDNTLDFSSAASPQAPILDLLTYNSALTRSGTVSLNTRHPAVLAAVLRRAITTEATSAIVNATNSDAMDAATAIVNATAVTPALSRADIVRLASGVVTAPFAGASDEVKETISRSLSECVQTRTWGLLIDLVAQTGRYPANATDLSQFIVEGEKRYWLHVAIDRFDGSIVGQQLEEVLE